MGLGPRDCAWRVTWTPGHHKDLHFMYAGVNCASCEPQTQAPAIFSGVEYL